MFCMMGTSADKTLRRISSIVEEIGDNEGVSLDEFLAFQHFFDNIDILKNKVQHLRYLDYLAFQDVIESFCDQNDFCKENKAKISDVQMQALFALFDADKSGELEPEELVIFSKETFGQSRDEKAKDEMAEYATKTIKKVKTWFSDIHTRLF